MQPNTQKERKDAVDMWEIVKLLRFFVMKRACRYQLIRLNYQMEFPSQLTPRLLLYIQNFTPKLMYQCHTGSKSVFTDAFGYVMHYFENNLNAYISCPETAVIWMDSEITDLLLLNIKSN